MPICTDYSCSVITLFTSPSKAVHTCADNAIQVSLLCQLQFFNIRHFNKNPYFKDFEIDKEL